MFAVFIPASNEPSGCLRDAEHLRRLLRGSNTNVSKRHIPLDLTESYIKGEILFEDALGIVKNKKIVYAKGATMQTMLSDNNGRVLIIEPGIGYRLEKTKYSLITNYSVLNTEITRPYIVFGDDRFERKSETKNNLQRKQINNRKRYAIQHIGIYFNHIGKFENELTQLAEPTEQEIKKMREEIEEAKKEKSRAYHREYSRAYRARNREQQREYNRIKAREYRARKKAQAAASAQ